MSADQEPGIVRLRKLGRLMAEALDDLAAEPGNEGSVWIAHVHPASRSPFPIGLENLNVREQLNPDGWDIAMPGQRSERLN